METFIYSGLNKEETMNQKMNMYLQELPTADGKTVKIISGFGNKSVDPEATKAVVAGLLAKTPEYAQAQSHQAKISAQRKIAGEAYALAEKAHNAGDKKNTAIHNASYQAALGAIAVLEDELRPLVEAYEAEFARLYEENPVYFPCGPGQCCCENYETLKAKFDALKERERLTDEGDVISDYRNVEYWHQGKDKKWVRVKIDNIGESPLMPFVLPENLTPEIQAEIAAQEEAERIAAMPKDDKAKAKQAALDALADEADRLDRRNKIQRKAFDPVAWYEEKAIEVEAKYA
jgi:hypothetical protein